MDLQARRDGESAANDPGEPEAEPEERDRGPRMSSAAVRPERENLDDPGRRWPWALLVSVAAVVLVAVAATVLLLRGDQPVDERQTEVVTPPQPTSPQPSPTPVETPGTRPTATDGPTLPDLLSKARHAQQSGDLDRAMVQLSILAMLDRDNAAVLETAREVIGALMERAEAAGNDPDGLETARAELDRARELARRFELPMRDIDRLERRLVAMERIHRCSPRDSGTLQSLIGRQVEVVLDDGDSMQGTLLAVSPESLTLETRKKIGGGGHVTYTTPIPVSTIEEVVYTETP
jgi:hypothetical protein